MPRAPRLVAWAVGRAASPAVHGCLDRNIGGLSVSAARPRSPKAPVPRLALSLGEAAASLGVSPDYFAEYVAPELCMVRRGRKRLIAVAELERWLDRNAARTLEEVA